ncbi:FAD/NAD(P)-binding domain-containing protein [Polychytrium aggregatum]|uniref:FAD/NAD(P)-binding domain-containing protein n=1 Tax=Polychytrium aggregatum TaxID=110093 RepID=UPI0022FE3297|nr:FAD/NAD(P)-binding domain-containing protein [Polychytrium aggregatum]KAI9207179.1 FAD/NAD(P)-binding domain-containing protein [Polychytrium aggregatum]
MNRSPPKPVLALAASILPQRILRRALASQAAKRERLVILGSGWAGFKLINEVNTKDYDVVVISPRNHFVFTPLLASTAVGTLEYRAITEPVRTYGRGISFHQATCDQIDFEKKEITCRPAFESQDAPFAIAFDKLVLAVGAKSNTFGIPGVAENAFFLKEVDHARKIRARIIECFEQASEPNTTEEQQRNLLHFAVVGGGPTGIEFSAELHDFCVEDLSKLYPQLKNKVRISVYDVAEKILGGFQAELAEYASEKFRREGIQIKTKTFIKEVKKNLMVLKDDTQIPFGALIWATGITSTPLGESLGGVMKEERSNRVITNEYLTILDKNGQALDGIYAIGDCAVIKDKNLPATAQVADQKGRWLTYHLNRQVAGKPTLKPFTYNHIASMVYTGAWSALIDFSSKGNLKGRLAWIFWRSAYLTKSVSVKNKILIPMYWFLSWAFGRDISRF